MFRAPTKPVAATGPWAGYPRCMDTIHDGIWTWTGTHPEWRTGTERVRSYALETGGGLAIVDPVLTDDVTVATLRELADGRPCAVFVTVDYHLRGGEEIARKLLAPIAGPPRTRAKLADAASIAFISTAGTPEPHLPLGARSIALGVKNGRRSEHPIYFPDVRALAVGDCIVSVPEGLRVWSHDGDNHADAHRRVADLAEVDIVLATHGEPVVHGGHDAIVEALTEAPTDYRVEQMYSSVRGSA